MMNQSFTNIRVRKVREKKYSEENDVLAAEEPLEIRITYGPDNNRIQKNISVTMRSPGSDDELVLGFLFTEGIILSKNDVIKIHHSEGNDGQPGNILVAELREGVEPQLKNSERNFYTTSSCGVCGKASIGAIRTVSNFNRPELDFQIPAELFFQLPISLRIRQQLFNETGGLHASALFNTKGELLLLREDIGRHNALDKLIGAAMREHSLPLSNEILLLSGRASFELVQKAVMAGIRVIAAVGAPSSLAVKTALEFDVTLLGFLREKRFNIYTAHQRIVLNHSATVPSSFTISS